MWLKQIHFLYLFGFFAHFQPANPFTLDFFSKFKQLQHETVQQNILPIFTYSHTFHSIFIFLLSDLSNFKPFLVFSSIASLISTSLRIWTNSLLEMENAQIFLGSAAANEIIYYIFIYMYYDVSKYEHLTAFIRAAPLGAQLISSLLGQFLLSNNYLNLQELHYINLIATIIATVLSIFIMTTQHHQHRYNPSEDSRIVPAGFTPKIRFIWGKFAESLNNKFMIKWIIWSSLSTCNFNQVTNFVQPLWHILQKSNEEHNYNGLVAAIAASASIFAILIGAILHIDWKNKSDLIMAVGSVIQFSTLISIASVDNIMVCYGCFIIFQVVHHFIISAISAEIAKISEKTCFGAVFGFIYLLAGSFNSILTCLVNDRVGYKMKPKDDFSAYAFFHLIIVVIFMGITIKQNITSIMARHQISNI